LATGSSIVVSGEANSVKIVRLNQIANIFYRHVYAILSQREIAESNIN